MDLVAVVESLRTLSKVSEAFLVITTIAVALRLWTRAGIMRSIQLDDWAMIVAYLCFVATCAITLKVSQEINGIFKGKPIHTDMLNKLVYADTGLYIITMIAIKISLGSFFLRIFAAHFPQRMIIYFVVIFSTVVGLAYLFFSMFSCGLTRGFFPGAKECKAWAAYAILSLTWSSINAATDMVFSLISIHALWIANMPPRTKFVASAVLVFGTVGGVASIIRIVFIYRAGNGPAALSTGLTSGYWTLIEAGIGITAASIACLRPLLRWSRERLGFGISQTAPTETADTTTMTDGIYSSKGFSKNLTGLSSALTEEGSQFPQVRDWRADRITMDMEFCSPNAAIMGSVLTLDSPSDTHRRSLQTHNLI